MHDDDDDEEKEEEEHDDDDDNLFKCETVSCIEAEAEENHKEEKAEAENFNKKSFKTKNLKQRKRNQVNQKLNLDKLKYSLKRTTEKEDESFGTILGWTLAIRQFPTLFQDLQRRQTFRFSAPADEDLEGGEKFD